MIQLNELKYTCKNDATCILFIIYHYLYFAVLLWYYLATES